MKNMTLLIMAAGMGSRFGGLKQIEPVGPNDEFIIDYSIYDAKKAGFNKVVFIIKKENYEIFKDNPTLIFENLNSCYVSITNGKHKVSVSATGYKWFGIWTKENAPYVCLEPWMSHSDFSLTNKDFYNREGTIVLKPETSYTISYTIEIG